MKRYLVSFTTNTPICIHRLPALEGSKDPKIFNNELQFTNQKILIQIYDNVVQYKSFTGRRGLRIDVALDSPDIISSVDKAGGYADAMLSFLVLCTSVYAPVVRFDFAYEITPGIDKHEYMRDFYLEDIQPLIQRKARASIYGEIFNASADHEDRVQGIATKKEWNKYTGLQRAVSWFRKGIGADDVVDEYVCYWIALEALDDLPPQDVTELPRAKCAKCERQIDICPFCKDDPKVFATISPLYGIEQLAQDTGLSEDEYHILRSLRNKIFHSIAALRVTRKQEETPLVESIRTKVPIVRNLLIDGLGRVLKLSKGTVQQIKEHEPLKESQTTRFRLKTYLQGVNIGSVSESGYPIHPSVELPLDDMRVQRLPNGNFELSGSRSCQFRNCQRVGNFTVEVELWSNVPTIEKAEISFSVQKHHES
jgi:hypothetical protein